MKKLSALLILCLAACEAPNNTDTLTFDGLGPIKLDMTFEAAQKAIGTPLARHAPAEGSECWYTHTVHTPDWTVGYMMMSDRVRRIDVRPSKTETPTVKTDTGIGIGATHDSVVKAYGDKIKVELNKYVSAEEGNDLVVDAPEGSARIVFETQKNASGVKAVTRFRVGLQPEVFLVEGCS